MANSLWNMVGVSLRSLAASSTTVGFLLVSRPERALARSLERPTVEDLEEVVNKLRTEIEHCEGSRAMRDKAFCINRKRGIVRSGQFGNGPLPNWDLNTLIALMKPFGPAPGGWYERLAGADAWGGCVSARSRCRIPGLAEDGAELRRVRTLQAQLCQGAGRGLAKSKEERKQPLSRALLMEYRAAAMLEKKLSALHLERAFVRRSQADRRGATQWNHRRGRGRESCWRTQPLPEGNQGGELAHAGAGQGAAHGP
jgi:hypothetical protein